MYISIKNKTLFGKQIKSSQLTELESNNYDKKNVHGDIHISIMSNIVDRTTDTASTLILHFETASMLASLGIKL